LTTGEIVQSSLLLVQCLTIAASVLYLAKQVKGEKHAMGFQVYSQITDAYLRHLWLATGQPFLNQVWEQWAEGDGRREELAEAQAETRAAGQSWGAWKIMTDEERTCYRYTRQAIELFEQAWDLQRRGLIADDTYEKWVNWMRIWKETRYFEFVFEDTRPRLIAPFCETFDGLC
jgi:hypothetical protein